MKIIVTLEEYVSSSEVKEVGNELSNLLSENSIPSKIYSDGEMRDLEKIWSSKGRRILIDTEHERLSDLGEVLRKHPDVSKIFPIHISNLASDIGEASKVIGEQSKRFINKDSAFEVEVKIWKRKYPTGRWFAQYVSKRVGQCVKRITGAEISYEKPENVLVVVLSDKIHAGFVKRSVYEKTRNRIAEDLFKDFVLIIENPSAKWEVMDMLRVASAFRIELRFVGNQTKIDDLIRRAIGSYSGSGWKQVIKKTYISTEQAVGDSLPIGFTLEGTDTEEKLLQIIRQHEHKQISLIFGNKEKGFSRKSRQTFKFNIHLGPLPISNIPLTTSQAAAYVLGCIATSRLQ